MEKFPFSPKKNTIGHQELISRLKDYGYNTTVIKEDFFYINEVRNQIVHHFNEAPIEELKTNMISLFSIVNAICGEFSETFWGVELWKSLRQLSEKSDLLLQKCKDSYKEIGFQPIDYYFRCLKCSSKLLLIIKTKKTHEFQCQFCKASFNKGTLISYLENSKNFYSTHQVIQYLLIYVNNLNGSDQRSILDARENNSQIYGIDTDDDISLFYDKVDELNKSS